MKQLFLFLFLNLFTSIIYASDDEKQTVVVNFSPTNAIVIIDDEMLSANNGSASLVLPIGEHSYSVLCNGYATDKGTFILSSSAPKILNVQLVEKSDTDTCAAKEQTVFKQTNQKHDIDKDFDLDQILEIHPLYFLGYKGNDPYPYEEVKDRINSTNQLKFNENRDEVKIDGVGNILFEEARLVLKHDLNKNITAVEYQWSRYSKSDYKRIRQDLIEFFSKKGLSLSVDNPVIYKGRKYSMHTENVGGPYSTFYYLCLTIEEK